MKSGKKIILCDADKCLGCHSCELACAVAHGEQDLQIANASGKMHYSRIMVVNAGHVPMPVQCRQCDNAPCAKVCPTGAIQVEDEMVVIHEALCVGCHVCTMVCPFGAISVVKKGPDSQSFACKCDLCRDLSDNHKNSISYACANACPTKALKVVDIQSHRNTLMETRAAQLASVNNSLNSKMVN